MRISDDQIIAILKGASSGNPSNGPAPQPWISDAISCTQTTKCGEMDAFDARNPKHTRR
jgi:hypothetical protein